MTRKKTLNNVDKAQDRSWRQVIVNATVDLDFDKGQGLSWPAD